MKGIMKNKKGFTIIEVVLVLAIAGLIFLMVFLALPALQRSQRDTFRKQQANMIRDVYSRKYANNKGRISWSDNLNSIIYTGYAKEEELKDPSTGEVYRSHPTALGGSLYHRFNIIPIGSYGYDTGGYCEGNIPRDIPGVNDYRNMVIVIPLEGGGVVCASNDMR